MFSKIYEKIKQFMKENYKGIITLIIIYLVFTIELPYSIYTPGGAVNLNDRIEVANGYDVDGSFNMAYVSTVRGSLPFVLISKVIPDWDLVKKKDITYDGESMNEMLERERLYLQESIDHATINAYKYAGKEVNITKTSNKIMYVDSNAKTDLKVGDEILQVNNEDITDLASLKKVVEALDTNVEVSVKINRDGKEKTVSSTTYKMEDITKLGVTLITTYEYETNPEVSVKTKSSEAGSSGGLMMTLTIYNQLVEEDITHGKKIVGTGTMELDGTVGEIGGVKYKLIGAVKNKAEVFICPEENYEEAKKIADERNYNIKIISVHTFEECLEKLKSL